MATIKQVAKRANVSVATVSRVMNNNGYVSAEAREAVERAIAELDYAPNRVARSLFTKTSGLIGLIMPYITNPFFPQLARVIEDVANQHGYQVVLCNTDEQLAKEQTYLIALQTVPGGKGANQAVEEGTMAATVAQKPTEIGKLGVEAAVNHLKGETVEENIPVDLELIK